MVGRGRRATRRCRSSRAARSRSSAPSGRSCRKPRTRYVYYPGGAEIPESVAPNIRNRSYTIAAELDIDTPDAGGVIFSQGSRFGGHALYVADGSCVRYNWVGEHVQIVESDEPVPTGHVVRVRLVRARERRAAQRRAR